MTDELKVGDNVRILDGRGHEYEQVWVDDSNLGMTAMIGKVGEIIDFDDHGNPMVMINEFDKAVHHGYIYPKGFVEKVN